LNWWISIVIETHPEKATIEKRKRASIVYPPLISTSTTTIITVVAISNRNNNHRSTGIIINIASALLPMNMILSP